jgi:hypothetical protein
VAAGNSPRGLGDLLGLLASLRLVYFALDCRSFVRLGCEALDVACSLQIARFLEQLAVQAFELAMVAKNPSTA